MAFPLLALGMSACHDDQDTLRVIPCEIKVTNAVLQTSYTIPDNGTITVLGNGFANGDAISLTDSLKHQYNGLVREVDAESITFGVDAAFPQKGYYTVRVHRNDDERVLGSTTIELVCDFGVQNIVVDSKYAVMVNHTMKVAGEGFLSTDCLKFTDTMTGSAFDGVTVNADAYGIDIKLPVDMPEASYKVEMVRNGRVAQIGTSTITQVADTEMEAKDGATIMGTVYCGFTPVANVVISDGVTLTRTDENGHYWLNSTKERGTVFVSVPSNYTVPVYKGTNTPHHYELLTEAAGVLEQHNFELIAENQHSFTILGMADAHLAKRDNDDIKQFQNGFLVDVNQTIDELKNEGELVYGITLGDLSWDTYWYKQSYNITDAIKELYKVNCPVYNCTGNHDHDIQIHDDFAAAELYIKTTGPTYYSINIGNTHIVVLDNIVYGALPGEGANSCKYYIEPVQWEWLKLDLATIENRNNPLIVCMHHALYRYPGLDADGNPLNFIGLDDNSGVDLVNLLADYSNVK
ncbi:MAG: metallophosphoesterase, partial [Muribaculaceae bacterium]|nr:metallophosphoesterase [Muribaculaceae bacterium]